MSQHVILKIKSQKSSTMSEKKKKINTAHYNELSRFVIDMSFVETVRILDASEKDMPQLRSDIVADDEDEKLMRLTYAEASALLILIKSWARGSMTQVTVFRGEATYAIPETVSDWGNPIDNLIGIIFMIFVMSFCSIFIFSVYFGFVAIFLFLLLMVIAYMPPKANPKPDITRISSKTVPTNSIYEKILLDYVTGKLKVESEEDIYKESTEENQQLKSRRS